jgi:tRNA nucleotidyltransferase/poly(A) polymerase
VASRRRRLSDAARVEAARRRLFARADVRAAADLARSRGISARLVGGAVRDALLEAAGARGRRGRDLDLSAPAGAAAPFAAALAARLGTRAVAVGPPGKRVLRLPLAGSEVDVFETAGSPDEDLLRRDFTVNSMAFDLGTGDFEAPAGALADLRAGRLALPRPGVLREDPLRVLRAARFLAELPGFRVASRALPEFRAAGRFLRTTAEERRLVEMNKLLAAPPKDRDRALRFLEKVGALGHLLRGAAARTRRRGLSFVSRLDSRNPAVARALLLLPLGAKRAGEILRKWKTTRQEQQLAKKLFTLPRAAGARPPSNPPTRREIVEVIRAVSPFLEEAVLFLSSLGDERSRRLASALRTLSRDPGRLARVLKPPRPVAVDEVASLLKISSGPDLGRALAALDVAVAAGEVASRPGALRLLARFGRGLPAPAPR